MYRIFIPTLALCIMLTLSSLCNADSKKIRFIGSVTEINKEDQTFTIKQHTDNHKPATFKVIPSSDFELHFLKSSKDEIDVQFQELKVGDEVKVKAYQGTPLIVDEVDIFR